MLSEAEQHDPSGREDGSNISATSEVNPGIGDLGAPHQYSRDAANNIPSGTALLFPASRSEDMERTRTS